MSRRQLTPSDSLEMLLDTMCNTFGGIILIALLIALLARDTKVSEAEAPQITDSTGLLQRQLERARKDLAQAQAFQASLERRASNPAQASLLQLIEERERARRASELLTEEIQSGHQQLTTGGTANHAQITDRINQMSAQALATERALLEQRNFGESLQGKIEEQKRGLQEESNRLAQAAARQVQRLRLPREHETTKTHLYVIVRYGRVYPLYLFRDGEPERNTGSLRWEQESATSKRIEVIPSQGMEVQPNSPALAQLFRDIPRDRIYAVFQVYQDSFTTFNAAKEVAVQQGLECTWEPRKNDFVLRLGPTAQAPPPQ